MGGAELHLVVGCRWCPFPMTISVCSMALLKPPLVFEGQSGRLQVAGGH
jgi:hypothetical protein